MELNEEILNKYHHYKLLKKQLNISCEFHKFFEWHTLTIGSQLHNAGGRRQFADPAHLTDGGQHRGSIYGGGGNRLNRRVQDSDVEYNWSVAGEFRGVDDSAERSFQRFEFQRRRTSAEVGAR